MEKNFLEVFNGLDLDKRNKELFEDVTVTQVLTNKARDLIRVYIKSDHVIPKASIYRVEKLIKLSVFSRKFGRVKIYETFNLSDYYTPEILFKEYRDSISLEMEKYGVVEKTLFDNSEVSFSQEGAIHLEVEDAGYLKMKSDEVRRIIEKIFLEDVVFLLKLVLAFMSHLKRMCLYMNLLR